MRLVSRLTLIHIALSMAVALMTLGLSTARKAIQHSTETALLLLAISSSLSLRLIATHNPINDPPEPALLLLLTISTMLLRLATAHKTVDDTA
jgi:hypothetical protein